MRLLIADLGGGLQDELLNFLLSTGLGPVELHGDLEMLLHELKQARHSDLVIVATSHSSERAAALAHWVADCCPEARVIALIRAPEEPRSAGPSPSNLRVLLEGSFHRELPRLLREWT